MKYGDLSLGQIEALVNKVGGMKGVREILDGKFRVGPPPLIVPPVGWTTDDDNNTHFFVISNGMKPEQWDTHFRLLNCDGDYGYSGNGYNALKHVTTPPTKGVAYHIVVVPRCKFGSFSTSTEKIRTYAAEKNWRTPHWEVACLIRNTFSNKQLEKMRTPSIVTMHEPIPDFHGNPCWLIGAGSVHGFRTYNEGLVDRTWGDSSFAFVISRFSAQGN